MKSLIILAHPYDKSFNHFIMNEVERELKKTKEVKVIDLVKDKFDAGLSQEDLSVYMQGKTSDPRVLEYQKDLLDCDDLVLIFPIWWYEAPAIFKGFLDKVLLPGFAFDEIDQKLVGKLGHIKRLTVLSTSEVLTDFMRNKAGNPIETSMMNMTLAICGIVTDTLWLNCERIVSGTDQDRELYIKSVIERFHR